MSYNNPIIFQAAVYFTNFNASNHAREMLVKAKINITTKTIIVNIFLYFVYE